QGTRAIDEVARRLGIAACVGAVAAERLSERSDDYVDLALEACGGDAPAPSRAERAGRVRLVDEHPRVIAVRQLDDLYQWRDVAVHREHAVGHDQAAPARCLGETPFEMLRIEMVVDEGLCPRKAATVDDASVVRGV